MGLQLTRGSEYALRAVLYLAERPEREISALRAVSNAKGVPESFMAKIFQSLVHAGLVVSHRGARGGFSLARPAGEITVAEVIEAIDGPISLNTCVIHPESCGQSTGCPVNEVWVRAQGAMMDVLAGVTFADLVAEPLAGAAERDPALL